MRLLFILLLCVMLLASCTPMTTAARFSINGNEFCVCGEIPPDSILPFSVVDRDERLELNQHPDTRSRSLLEHCPPEEQHAQ